MTVCGSGGLGTDYHIQAGYFSTAAVDMLRGSMPKVPILDLPIEQLEVFDRLTQQFYAALIQEAKRIHSVTDPEAIIIATKSGRAAAEKRLAKHEAGLARAQRELLRATGRVESVTNRLAEARARWKERSTAARDLESDVGAAKLEVEEKRCDVDDALTALKDAELAQTADPTLTQPVTDAKSTLLEAEKASTAATGKLKEARRRKGVANTREAEARRRLREVDIKRAAAERALDRAQNKLDLEQLEVLRNQAARDAAIKMMEAVNAKFEFDPFSPLAEGAGSQVLDDPQIIKLARVVWFGSLSSSDLASIGMTGTTNPYQFRKLVFWATAANIDLNEFAGEIDGIMDNVVGIASTMRTQHNRLKSQSKSRRKALDDIIDVLPLEGLQRDILRGLIEISAPSAEDDGAIANGEGS